MNASELYKAGKLQEAVAAQTQEVKSHPADQNKRLFLFELLAFAGNLDRARKQLDVLKFDQMELETAAQSYRKLLDAEEQRRKLFSQGLQPQFLADPPEHVRLRLEAVNRLREQNLAEAAATLAQAATVTPVLHGELNGQRFDEFRDADDLFGPVLEVMAHGNYFWVPLEQVELVAMKPPRFPRDLLWVPARLETASSTGDVFLPALYPNSHEHADDTVKLGRQTDWRNGESGPVLGVGLRVFLAGEADVSLLEWRELKIEPSISGMVS
ncbi:MAG: SciE type virulence protein [Planctomycetia bacterium]|nr:SciE type virulence protein [Planctomycetia bacterium]